MHALLDRIHKRNSHKQEAEHTQTWSLALDTYHLKWSIDEATTLIAAENKHPAYVTLHREDGPQGFQTLVLNVDIEKNNLCLDHFYPTLSMASLYRSGPFDLTIPAENRQLILRCIPVGEVGPYARESVAVKIIAKYWSTDAKANERISFSGLSAPPVTLLIPMHTCLVGQILQISPFDFEITTLKLQPSNLRDLEAECTISFSESFSFKAYSRIKDSRTHRKPHTHTHIKGAFIKLTDAKKEQLEAFIHLLNGNIR